MSAAAVSESQVALDTALASSSTSSVASGTKRKNASDGPLCQWVISLLAVARGGFHDKDNMCSCSCPEGLTCMLVFAIFAAVLGMFQFGYNTGVVNAPQKIIKDFIGDLYFRRTGTKITDSHRDLIWAVAVSIFGIGGMLGGISGGSIANRFGRKGGLLLNNTMGILGAILMGLSKLSRSFELLIFGRLVIGFNCGLNTALVPMYLSEIAPLTLRGGLGTVSQLGVTIGLMLSQVLGIQEILGTENGWPILFGIAVVPAVLQLLLLPFCPESPRYLLISKQEESLAREALQKLRCSYEVEDDIEEMKAEDRGQQQEARGCPVALQLMLQAGVVEQVPNDRFTIWQLLCTKSLRLPLMIGIVMQLSQQLSGINAVLYYSTALFVAAGLTDNAATYATIGVGAVMVIMTLVSIPLMDRTGRRTLHLYGLGGMFIFSIFITISLLVRFLYHWVTYLSVVSTLSYVLFFALGPGSIPWMITAELFSQGPRPAAISVAVLVNWFASFIIALVFPTMQNNMENYMFLPFTVMLAIFWTFTYKKVPETKNKTFEEISALFRRDDIVNINGIPVPRKSLQGRGDLLFEDKPVESSTLCQCAHEVIILPELTSLHKWHQQVAASGLPPELAASAAGELLSSEAAAADGSTVGAVPGTTAAHLHGGGNDEDDEDEDSLALAAAVRGSPTDDKASLRSDACSSRLSESGRSANAGGSSSGAASDDETSTSDVQHKKRPSPMQRHHTGHSLPRQHRLVACQCNSPYQRRKSLIEITANHLEQQL